MPTLARLLPLTLPTLLAHFTAPPALATLGQESFGIAGARFTGDDDPGHESLGGGGLSVAVNAFATETQELGPTYKADFEFESSFTGNGFVTYGYAEEELSTLATATPESVDPVAPGDPLLNAHTAVFNGDVEVFFSDTGVVTGPSGAPVALEVTVASSGEGAFFGCNGTFARSAGTTSDVDVIDISGGSVGVEFLFFGPDTQTLTLDTAVGHELAINGRFRVFAEGTAGRGSGFVETCSAQAANASYVTFSLPQGFGVAAQSGHDYTIPAPEPGQALLALAGTLALAVARIGRR